MAAAVGAVSGCSGETTGSVQSATLAAVTPTVSAEVIVPSSADAPAVGAASDAPTRSSNAADPSAPTTSTSEATAGAVSPSAASPTLLPEVTAPTDPKEIADRQAVEAAWVRFWDYYPTFEELSPQERQSIADSISVDPLKTQILEGAANADANGESGYGTVTHRISWYQSVDGQQQIAIADCMDQDKMGTDDRSTGKKLSKGYPRTNLRGDVVLGADGVWRVRNLYYLTDETC